MLFVALLALLVASTLNQDEAPTPTPEPLPWEISTPTPPGRPACPATPPAWWGQETPSPGWYFRCGHCVGSWPGQVPFPPTPTPLFRATLPPVGTVTPTPSPTPTRLPGCTWDGSGYGNLADPNCVYVTVEVGYDCSTWSIYWVLYPLGLSGGLGTYKTVLRVENFRALRLVWWASGPPAKTGCSMMDYQDDYIRVRVHGGYGSLGNPGDPLTITYSINASIFPGSSTKEYVYWNLYVNAPNASSLGFENLRLSTEGPSSGSISGSGVYTNGFLGWVSGVYYSVRSGGSLLGNITGLATVQTSGDVSLVFTNPRYVGGGDLPPITPTPPPSFGATPTPEPGGGGGEGGEVGDPSLCLDPNPGQQVEILPIPRYFGDYCVSVGPMGPYNIPLVGEVRVPLVKVCFRPTSFGTFDFLGFRFNADLFLGTLVGFALIRFLWG